MTYFLKNEIGGLTQKLDLVFSSLVFCYVGIFTKVQIFSNTGQDFIDSNILFFK